MRELLSNEKRLALRFARTEHMVEYVSGAPIGILSNCPVDQARGKDKTRLNELFIMLDTETSKSRKDVQLRDGSYKDNDNYIVSWSCAFNILGFDVMTIWGDSPEQITPFMQECHETMKGNKTIFYVHNLSYDWQFLRKWCYRAWGDPVSQLNTKPHYPVNIEFSNGIVLRDSLILAQRSIEKWAKDLGVPHGKAVGSWDYDRIRHQKEPLSEEEINYIVCDVLAGVECLNVLRRTLGCTYASMPYTQTGIVRTAGREAGKPHGAHRLAKSCYEKGYEVYHLLTEIYHGGYTHANRHLSGWTIEEDIKAYDFSSSYPFCMLTEPMPAERFWPARFPVDSNYIEMNAKKTAFIFRFRARDVHLKDPDEPFPVLQLCKVRRIIDCVIDNGRVLDAGYVDIYLNEIDYLLIRRQYTWAEASFDDVYCSAKELLPAWLRDFVYDLYKQKTQLKGGDKVLYAIAKAKLNSVYGMCVQRVLMDDIVEDPESGEYSMITKDTPEEFEHEVNKRGTFLFYAWGVWTTSAAQRNVQDLTLCVNSRTENALYVDTDSCYATDWNENDLRMYNKICRAKLEAAGYEPVIFNGREYIPGVAELDGEYTQFRTVGAKRYCCREKDGGLKLTVSGVPKKAGAKCLNDDISNFHSGFTFKGEITGKLTHLYQYVPEIYQNAHGDWIADSVNLVPCDYLLDESIEHAIDSFGEEEIYIQVYDEELL